MATTLMGPMDTAMAGEVQLLHHTVTPQREFGLKAIFGRKVYLYDPIFHAGMTRKLKKMISSGFKE